MKNIRVNDIREKINGNINFSGVLSVKMKGEILIQEAYGFAEISNERKNNVDTRFGIASGAKLFTAIGICKLVEKGSLSFESLLSEVLVKEFNNFHPEVKIKHLLTHTSGIPDYFDEEVMSDFSELWIENPMYLLRNPKDFTKLLKKGKTMFNPGERFHYNNGAFVVLALVIEKVSGMDFVDYIKKYILDVVNMNQSGYFSMDNLPRNCAYGYVQNKGGELVTNIYSVPVVGGGDGGIFVTANDMSKLWWGLFNHKLLSKEITQQLLMPHVHVSNNIYYGYGNWIVKNEQDEIQEYFITGSDPGVDFRSAVYPKSDYEITALCNRESCAYDIAYFVESIIL